MSNLIEDLLFLKQLQQELGTQESDYQASPRFWVVGDYRWVPCPDDYAERFSVYLPTECESYVVEKYISDLDLEEMDDEAREAFEDLDLDCYSDILEWIQKYVDEGAMIIGERKEHFIRENTMFLTKSEAKRHIELNHYHYTKEAHTYAMSAWRAPTVSRLLTILEECDFDKLLQIVGEHHEYAAKTD